MDPSPAGTMLGGARGVAVAHAGMKRTGSRVGIDGKFLSLDGRRFPVRGVPYGTFAPRADGALFPETDRLRSDLRSMRDAGFNTLRTYTTPPPDLLDIAAEQGLHVIAGIFYPDWRHLVGVGRRGQNRIAAGAADHVKAGMRLLAGRPEVLAACIGNESPTDALRWVGHRKVASVLDDLADLVHDADPEMLVTYGNYPTAEYLTLERVDFVTFNVFLDRADDLRRYLSRLQNL